MKNLHSLQFMRFIAATLVVIFHSSTQGLNFALPHIEDLARFGAVGVHLFFVISGFIMVYASRKKFGVSGASGRFLISRLLRVFPVFWVFNIAYLLCYLFIAGIFPQREISTILLSFSLIPPYGEAIVGPAWTLAFELYFYVVFSFLLVFKLEKSLVIIALFFVVSVLFGAFIPEKTPIIHVVTNSLLMEFLFGILIGYLFIKDVKFHDYVLKAAIAIGVVALLLGAATFLYEKIPTILAWGLPSALIIFGVVMREKANANAFITKYSWLGDSSYSLYLFHILIIKLIFSFEPAQKLSVNMYGEVVVIGLTIISIISGILAYKYVETPMLIYLKKVISNFQTQR